jgi:hypothetical protein
VNTTRSLEKFRVPIGNQEIELQEVIIEGGNMNMLRLRVRERTRFTIFDIDPQTAGHWAKVMLEWAEANGGAASDEPAPAETPVA